MQCSGLADGVSEGMAARAGSRAGRHECRRTRRRRHGRTSEAVMFGAVRLEVCCAFRRIKH
eukprot:4203674-Prymnesium_polylepis.1